MRYQYRCSGSQVCRIGGRGTAAWLCDRQFHNTAEHRGTAAGPARIRVSGVAGREDPSDYETTPNGGADVLLAEIARGGIEWAAGRGRKRTGGSEAIDVRR